MNGHSRSDNSTNHQAPAPLNREQLSQILRGPARDAKIIFGALRGVFDLDRRDIENFFHLVDQRIREQNKCLSSSCEFAIYYNDGSSRKFPSAGEFSEYSETRKRVPTVITVHLSYHIVFPDSEQAERQDIDLVIRVSDTPRETLDIVENDSHVRMSGDKIQVMVGSKNHNFGVVTYNINHTRISWGLDLESHIKSHVDKLMSPPTKADRILRILSGPLNLITTLFVGLYLVNLIIDAFFKFLYSTDGAQTPDDIMRIAAQYLVNGHIAKYIVASIVVAGLVFVLFSGFVSALTDSIRKPRPSFIVLDQADENYKKGKLKIYERRWTRFAAILGMNIVVALIMFFLEERFAALLNR